MREGEAQASFRPAPAKACGTAGAAETTDAELACGHHLPA